jgi:predicted nucleic-acid-binding protein
VTGLDTNVVVRHLVQDDPKQSARASRLIESTEREGGSLFLSQIVLCEVVWVLESAYREPRRRVAEALEKMLLAPVFVVEERDDVRAALATYRQGSADFADYLVGRAGARHGCSRTLTFDRGLAGVPDFDLL